MWVLQLPVCFPEYIFPAKGRELGEKKNIKLVLKKNSLNIWVKVALFALVFLQISQYKQT